MIWRWKPTFGPFGKIASDEKEEKISVEPDAAQPRIICRDDLHGITPPGVDPKHRTEVIRPNRSSADAAVSLHRPPVVAPQYRRETILRSPAQTEQGAAQKRPSPPRREGTADPLGRPPPVPAEFRVERVGSPRTRAQASEKGPSTKSFSERSRKELGREGERRVICLLQRENTTVVGTGDGADGGIDAIVYLSNLKIGVEVKNHNKQIGRPDIQKFHGAITNLRYDAGLFVSFAGFSRTAIVYAEQSGILLVDGEQFAAFEAGRGALSVYLSAWTATKLHAKSAKGTKNGRAARSRR